MQLTCCVVCQLYLFLLLLRLMYYLADLTFAVDWAYKMYFLSQSALCVKLHLQYVCFTSCLPCVIESFAVPSSQNNITPLHVASRWGKSNMVQLLLDNKATIDEKTRVSAVTLFFCLFLMC